MENMTENTNRGTGIGPAGPVATRPKLKNQPKSASAKEEPSEYGQTLYHCLHDSGAPVKYSSIALWTVAEYQLPHGFSSFLHVLGNLYEKFEWYKNNCFVLESLIAVFRRNSCNYM